MVIGWYNDKNENKSGINFESVVGMSWSVCKAFTSTLQQWLAVFSSAASCDEQQLL